MGKLVLIAAFICNVQSDKQTLAGNIEMVNFSITSDAHYSDTGTSVTYM